jgi:two-component system response regulator YesN
MLQFLEETASKAYPRADVQTFLHAKSALEYAENFGCDVLLCEINPPRLEGLFLAEKIKNINPKVNIIFVTVCSESEHAKAVMRLKPSGYLTKEATSAQILEELQNLRYPVA